MRRAMLRPARTPTCTLACVGVLGLGVISIAGCRAETSAAEPTPEITAPTATPSEQVEPARPPISDDPVIQAIVELAETDSQVDDHLAALAVEIGGRLTGSTQLTEAELWAVDRFEDWGLRVTREQWGEFPVRFERGKASGEVVRPQRRELEIGTWAWSPGTNGQDGLDAGAPVRGQALRHPTDASSLRAVKPYLRGAWIMVPHDFAAPSGALRQQIERAFAAAPIAGLVFAAGGPDDTRIHTWGSHALDPAKLPKRIEIRLRGDQHHELMQQLDAGVFIELAFGVANRLEPGPVPVFNVIAELPGAELPNERVVIGAHLDSWDEASGAIDNATGVATTMEAARLLAAACAATGRAPKRSLSFQLWTGEEQGLLGSKAWVAAHPDLLPGISAVLVHDEGTNYLSGVPVTPEQYAVMTEVFEPITKLAPETMPFALRVVEGLPFESSDSSSFLHAGVPAFFWAQSGRSDYDRYHHTQYDHADAVIDEYQRHSALVVAIAAWQLAELPGLIDRRNLEQLPARRIGVVLDGVKIEAIEDGVGKRAGLQVGDAIVEIDGVVVADTGALVSALDRGDPRKQAVIVRTRADASTERIDISLDWSDDPSEAQRSARRAERRERFGLELRPWDQQSQGDQHE